jgi:L-2-hydroxyglutarate oxidase
VHRLARDAERAGATLYLGHRVTDTEVASSAGADHVLHTNAGDVAADYVVNAAGLHADRVARPFGVGSDVRVVPFRGEYYEMLHDAADAVHGMIYPTPDPELPFLGVHYTRRTDGKVIVGPNAVLAFGREAYRNTQVDLRDLVGTLTYPGFLRLMASRKMLRVAASELNKSYRKRAFVAAAQRLVPDVADGDFAKSYAGIRAQLVSRDGELVKDPVFEHGDRSTHVLNAVSPGLTCSLPFGEHLADAVEQRL